MEEVGSSWVEETGSWMGRASSLWLGKPVSRGWGGRFVSGGEVGSFRVGRPVRSGGEAGSFRVGDTGSFRVGDTGSSRVGDTGFSWVGRPVRLGWGGRFVSGGEAGSSRVGDTGSSRVGDTNTLVIIMNADGTTDDLAVAGSLPSLLSSEPLEMHGMRAGISAHDHGPFRAAATVRPVDLVASSTIVVPPDDVVDCPPPRPVLRADPVYATVVLPDGDRLDLVADVLTPAGEGPFPVVVFVPGGGFVLSPKSGALIRRTAMAQRGFVVVSIEYRTLRHGTYRDGVADVAAAVEWVRSDADRFVDEFGGDAARIALWGESAGGYLSSMAVTTGAVSGVACVVDVFGLTDLSQVAMDFDAEEQARHVTPEITEAQYIFGRGSGMTILDDPDEVQRANPVAQVGGHEPPFLLLHGERDGLVSPGQTQLLHQALLAAGVDSRRVVVEGAGHYGMEWSSTTVTELIAAFLHEHLVTNRSNERGAR